MPVIARLSTEHFEFIALGNDKAHASVTMLDTLRQHGHDFDCDTMWWLAHEDDVTYHGLQVGQGIRDDSIIYDDRVTRHGD